jgi:hypothetical protein
VRVGGLGGSLKWKKKLYEGLGKRKVPKQKLRSGLRNGKKLKSTCQPPWLEQGQEKKIPLVHHPSRMVHLWVSASLKL